jgi:hypothetical protein
MKSMTISAKSTTIAAVCFGIGKGDYAQATSLLTRDYPFAPDPVSLRKDGAVEFNSCVRSRWIHRSIYGRTPYCPRSPAFSCSRATDSLSVSFELESRRNSPSIWEMGAIVDHLVPVGRGGADDESNRITTSMARNSAKSNWSAGYPKSTGGDKSSGVK